MHASSKMLRIKGGTISLPEITAFLNAAGEKTEGFSLRARRSTEIVDGVEREVQVLFLRDGSEPLLKRFYCWVHAGQQRLAARKLIAAAILGQAPCTGPDLARDRALLQIRSMKRLTPGCVRQVMSALTVGRDRTGILTRAFSLFQDNEMARARKSFSAFLLQDGAGLDALVLRKMPGAGAHCILEEANWHWHCSLLEQFLGFSRAIANGRAIGAIDLGMVSEFLLEWERYAGDPAVQSPLHPFWAVPHEAGLRIGELVMACRRKPHPHAAQTAAQPDSCAALAPLRPACAAKPASGRAAVQPPPVTATLFESLWACSAGRHAMAAHAAFRMLAGPARRLVKQAPAAPDGDNRSLPGDNRPSFSPAPGLLALPVTALRIEPASRLQDICCDSQSRLDLADIGQGAAVLMRSSAGPDSMSPQCEEWLHGLRRLPQGAEPHFNTVRDGERTILLARHQVAPLNGRLSALQVKAIEDMSAAALDLAAAQGRPACLTTLFDYDPSTVDQCVEAMLAPLRRLLRQGLAPAVHIRAASPRLQEAISRALRTSTPATRGLVLADVLTEADITEPGMMMLTAGTSGFAAGPLKKVLARLRAQFREAPADRVRPRRQLGQDSYARLYYFADPCPLRNRLPDGPAMAAAYADFFAAARMHGCRQASIEVLSEAPGHEGVLVAALAAAVMAAQSASPGLRVRVLTGNPAIRQGLETLF